jgi:hypothetical protein
MSYEYRPNWGFDGLGLGPAQTGAPVFSWAQEIVHPGDRVRAVMVPMFPELWTGVDLGSRLTMYEGQRLCGRASVLWRTTTGWPVGEEDYGRFDAWTRPHSDGVESTIF